MGVPVHRVRAAAAAAAPREEPAGANAPWRAWPAAPAADRADRAGAEAPVGAVAIRADRALRSSVSMRHLRSRPSRCGPPAEAPGVRAGPDRRAVQVDPLAPGVTRLDSPWSPGVLEAQ